MTIVYEENFDTLIQTSYSDFANIAAHVDVTSTLQDPSDMDDVNMRMLHLGNANGTAVARFDNVSKHLLSVSVYNRNDPSAQYCWYHPDQRADYKFLDDMGTDPDETWHETCSITDILGKAQAILSNQEFDHRVVLVLDLSEETLAHIDQLAVELGCDRDGAIEHLLKEVINLKQTDPEKFDRVFGPAQVAE